MRTTTHLASGNPAAVWHIYKVTRRTDGRGYVGVTRRPLPVRLEAHKFLALRRPTLGGPGSLAEAIRQAHARHQSFAEAFEARILAVTKDPKEARGLERAMIEQHGTARPAGFNIQPGGASLGGPANAQPVSVRHPRRGLLTYSSMMEAITDLNAERRSLGLKKLQLSTAYARCAMGWPPEEALGLREHADGRRQREAFRWNGRLFHDLHEIALAEGIPIDTLRSRLHRARQSGCVGEYDLSVDRRLPGAPRTSGDHHGRLPSLHLPHPQQPDAPPVGVRRFAELTGLPFSTVLHRYHRLDSRQDPATLSREEILSVLTTPDERRILISLPLPGGEVLHGGVRELIHRVLNEQRLQAGRVEHLGLSAIRARLRRIPGWPDQVSRNAVAWAFGYRPDARPDGDAARTA